LRRSTGNPANAASRTDGRDPDPSNRHTGATDCGSGLAWDAPAPHGQEMTLVSRVVVGEDRRGSPERIAARPSRLAWRVNRGQCCEARLHGEVTLA